MISWLKGQIIQNWHLSSKRGVVLNVGGVGYDVHLLSKQVDLIDNSKFIELWIHQINREDCTYLYGFNKIEQRDLFRKIITVNGIGAQIGMALLEELEVNQIVNAIEEGDIKLLTKSQGIGKRIAERLVIELKNNLKQFTRNAEISNDKTKNKITNSLGEYLEEISSILNSLGYMDNEIKDSIKFITTNKKEHTLITDPISAEAKTELMDRLLKEILIRLSQKGT